MGVGLGVHGKGMSSLESSDALHSVPGSKLLEERGRAVRGFPGHRCHLSMGLRGEGPAQA